MINIDRIDSQKSSSYLQGQSSIHTVIYLKKNNLKQYVLLPLLCLSTCFIILAFMRKIKKIHVFLLYQQCQLNQATHLLILGSDKSSQLQMIHQSKDNLLFFFFRKVKYEINQDGWNVYSFKLGDQKLVNNQQYMKYGLSSQQHKQSIQKFGYCQHLVQIPSLINYLIDEMIGIFFILQYLICLIYIIEQYVSYSVIMVIASILTTLLNYYLLKTSYQKIKQNAEKQYQVIVIRNSKQQKIISKYLVPGDIFIPKNQIPCDAILLRGQLYLNQSNLSGQSIPIAKFAKQKNTIDLNQTNWLYQGSKVLQDRGEPLAIVIHTGFITRKGKILRKIIFKKNQQPEFFKNGFLFLCQMLIVCTISYLILLKYMIHIEIKKSYIFFRFFDMLGWVMPPTFPSFFNLCYSFSLKRLQSRKIFGTQPFKTITSGKVKTICFDKTGTLTQNRMKLFSIIKLNHNQLKQKKLQFQNEIQDDGITNQLFGTCHTVKKIDEQYQGDELDLRMFLISGYKQQQSEKLNIISIYKKKQRKLEVLKINQFQSKFKSMSVIVRDLSLNKYFVFVKGAPQKINNISINKYQQLQKIVTNISLQGLRSLAYAYKQIDNIDVALNQSRQLLETKLTILGIVTFQNKLKSDTLQIIKNLKKADIQIKMITGDNIYIGIQTAIRAEIIKQQQKILIFEGHKQIQPEKKYVAELLYKKNQKIYTKTLEMSLFDYQHQMIPIAIDNQFLQLKPFLPPSIKIFARINPESKALIIHRLKRSIQQTWSNQSAWNRITGNTRSRVGMVGDGANDIMAIKQADLGIGITQTDSSFAAHFSISQLIDVEYIIRQGRSTLMIAIEIFRYYCFINIYKYICVMILTSDYSQYSGNQYSFMNYAQTFEIVVFLCLSRPLQNLSKTIPNDNSMGLQNHFLIYGHLIFATISTILTLNVYYWSNGSQKNSKQDQWKFKCGTNTVMYICTQFFYMTMVIWIYKSQPWKKKIWKNYLLSLQLIIVIVINFILFFDNKMSDYFGNFFGLINLEGNLKLQLLLITCCFLVVCYLWEYLIEKIKIKRSDEN